MNLYLDDVRPCPLIGWTVARSVQEAIDAVTACVERGETWTDASLDHDMSVDQSLGYFKTGDVTGLDFIDWMIQNNRWPTRKPTVHSANPVGAKRMRQAIDRYGPYTTEGTP